MSNAHVACASLSGKSIAGARLTVAVVPADGAAAPGNRVLDFLVFLGLIVPPVAAVYLTDFFVLGRTDYQFAAHRQMFMLTKANALIGFVLGALNGCGLYLG